MPRWHTAASVKPFNWYPIPHGAAVRGISGLVLRLLTSDGVYIANFAVDPPAGTPDMGPSSDRHGSIT
jgi:hypothetical protein